MMWKENDYSRKYDSTPRDLPDLPNTPETDPVRLATIVRARNRHTASRKRLKASYSAEDGPAPLYRLERKELGSARMS